MFISDAMEFLLCKGYKLDFTIWQRVKSLAKLEKLVFDYKRIPEISYNIRAYIMYMLHTTSMFKLPSHQPTISWAFDQVPQRCVFGRLVGGLINIYGWSTYPPPPNVHPSKNSRPYDQSLWKPLVLFPTLEGGRLTSIPVARSTKIRCLFLFLRHTVPGISWSFGIFGCRRVEAKPMTHI